MAYSSAQACCAPGALPPAEFSPSDTWPLLFASTGSFLHLRTSPPPFLLPRCVSRGSLPTEEPSPLSALHLQGSTRKLSPELSPINPTCRGGWAMISPALYEILAMPDPSTLFICFFFPNVKSASRSPSKIMCPYSTPNSPDLQVQSFLTTHGAHKVPFYPPGISQLPSASHFHALPHPPTSQWPEPRRPAHQAICGPGRPPTRHVGSAL